MVKIYKFAPVRRRANLGTLAVALLLFGAGFLGVWLFSAARQPSGQTMLLAGSTPAAYPALRMCYPGERNTSTKTCVVDGDTLWLGGIDYRLKDFDTPEPQTDICGGDAEVALAHKASARLLQLLNGNAWTIETFGKDDTGRRVLATIRINGRDVGDTLIAERLARRWPDGEEWWCAN